jgi:hypothetical protein
MTIGRIVVWVIVGTLPGTLDLEKEAERMMKVQ